MADLTAIEANLEDAAHQRAIRSLLDGYARDPMGDGRALPRDVLERLIPGLQRHPTSLVFLAFDGDEAIGLAVCFVGFSTFAARPLVNLHDLAVTPGQRGRGAGRLLLQRVEARARELGCCRLTLEVRSDNDRARGLYASFGFRDKAFGSGREAVLFQEKSLTPLRRVPGSA